MQKAFTLIELLVVVLIIGILSAIALPQYQKAVEKSRAAEAVQILKYMHQQGALCELANGEGGCDMMKNKDIGIELGSGFGCEYIDDEVERCCNHHWCYDNNGMAQGNDCADGAPTSPVAFRIPSWPDEISQAYENRLYTLEYSACEYANYHNQIVCYESDKWCKMWNGVGKPIS